MAKVVIFGAAEAAVLMHFYLTHDSPHEVVAFTVDRDFLKEETLCGLPVVPFEDIESTYPSSDYKMFVAMFYGRVNRTRAENHSQAKAKGYQLISYISSRAVTWPGLVVGDNCFIGEACAIGPFVKIGNDVSIHLGSVVGHESIIKDHCFLAAHAVILGCVTLEPYCFLGGNSTIVNNVTIARGCIIGAGVSISKNTQERGVYVGTPAGLLPKSSDAIGQWLTWPAK